MIRRFIKTSVLILFASFVFILSSCNMFKNESIEMPNGVDISIPDDWKEHFLCPDDVPSLHFGYDKINVLSASTKDHYTFVNNDFYAISDAWEKFLIEHKDRYIITRASKQENEKYPGSARFGGEMIPLAEFIDDEKRVKQECSMEYLIVCFGEDGTRYSCSFRTFVGEKNGVSKRYYGYSYTGNLEIRLNLSVMVIKEDSGEKKLVLLPLPFDTKYTISNTTRLDALLKQDSYLKESNYVFEYPTTYHDKHYVVEGSNQVKHEFDILDRQEFIKQWYEKYCNGVRDELDVSMYIEYAGVRFRVDFGSEEEGFKLTYISKA